MDRWDNKTSDFNSTIITNNSRDSSILNDHIGQLFLLLGTTHKSIPAAGVPELCCHGNSNKHAVNIVEQS